MVVKINGRKVLLLEKMPDLKTNSKVALSFVVCTPNGILEGLGIFSGKSLIQVDGGAM